MAAVERCSPWNHAQDRDCRCSRQTYEIKGFDTFILIGSAQIAQLDDIAVVCCGQKQTTFQARRHPMIRVFVMCFYCFSDETEEADDAGVFYFDLVPRIKVDDANRLDVSGGFY